MNRNVWQGLLMTGFAAGCVRAPPPPELEEARATYKRVSTGPAAQQNPSALADAKATLDDAEKSYEDNVYNVSRDRDYYTRDMAYVANRKAQLAEAESNAALAAQQKARLEKELAERKERSEAEKRARAEADRKAAEAAQKLADIASVKQEERGTVLTLIGNILFGSGQHNLRADSLSKLDRVAVGLKDMGGKSFLIEGYTDSVGSDALNQQLSMKRAAAVREYLIHHGLPPDQVTAVGRGKESPVAPNDSADGRAKNRRVEIVVQPSQS